MKAVLSSCILRCLLGGRSMRSKRNDIKEQQRLPKPAPMTERRRRGPLFLIFIIFRIMQVIRNIGERKSPLFRVSGLSGGSCAFWAGWAGFSRFVQLCYLNALLCMFGQLFCFTIVRLLVKPFLTLMSSSLPLDSGAAYLQQAFLYLCRPNCFCNTTMQSLHWA